ncbi:MAG: ABC transporter permease [Actinomycetota bacterium]
MGLPAALRVANRDLVMYRRIWRENVIGAFVQPVLFLLGVGLGIGSLVDDGANADTILGDVSYFAFYASALLATAAMFNASQEALWPTADGFEWSNAYRAMIATPIRAADIAAGFAVRFAGRTFITAVGVASVLACFADTRTWRLIPAVLVAILCGLAFAMPIAAWTASQHGTETFPSIIRFVLTPMFLFAGAFYPIEQLPTIAQAVAAATPLWHAIELSRGLILDDLDRSWIVHVVVLFAYIAAGYGACVITLERRLRP